MYVCMTVPLYFLFNIYLSPQWSQLEENESGVGDEEVAEEEARRISTSLGCSSSSSGQNGGQGEGWQQSLETPTTQPPAPTG